MNTKNICCCSNKFPYVWPNPLFMKITKEQLEQLIRTLVREVLAEELEFRPLTDDEPDFPTFEEFKIYLKLKEIIDAHFDQDQNEILMIDKIVLDSEDDFNSLDNGLILEWQQYKQIPRTTLVYRLDKGNTNTKTQDHIHVYSKQNQLYAINKDGTPHDGSKAQIGKKEIDFLKKIGFTPPADGILEWITLDMNREYYELNYTLLKS